MDEILVAIDALVPADRALLRARMLARYDVGGHNALARGGNSND